jgi:antitoxin YefM
MPTETSYTRACANLAELCDQVTSTREPIVIRRRGSEDVALVAASELRRLTETAHLLRSPKNAQRLLTALIRAQSQESSRGSATSVQEMGLRTDDALLDNDVPSMSTCE